MLPRRRCVIGWRLLRWSPPRRWGTVVVVAEAWLRPVQDLIKWDAPGAARAELASRKEAGFPPAVTMAAIDGTTESIEQLLEVWEQPEGTHVLYRGVASRRSFTCWVDTSAGRPSAAIDC